MVVLGLDPGARFGFAVWDDERRRVVESGVIRVRLGKTDSLGCRMSRLAIQVTQVAERVRARAFAIESNRGFQSHGGDTQRLHGGYEAVCALIAYGLAVPLRTWAPNSLKKTSTEQLTAPEIRRCRDARTAAKTKPQKKAAGKLINTTLAERLKGGPVLDDNEADAICAAWATAQEMVF